MPIISEIHLNLGTSHTKVIFDTSRTIKYSIGNIHNFPCLNERLLCSQCSLVIMTPTDLVAQGPCLWVVGVGAWYPPLPHPHSPISSVSHPKQSAENKRNRINSYANLNLFYSKEKDLVWHRTPRNPLQI